MSDPPYMGGTDTPDGQFSDFSYLPDADSSVRTHDTSNVTQFGDIDQFAQYQVCEEQVIDFFERLSSAHYASNTHNQAQSSQAGSYTDQNARPNDADHGETVQSGATSDTQTYMSSLSLDELSNPYFKTPDLPGSVLEGTQTREAMLAQIVSHSSAEGELGAVPASSPDLDRKQLLCPVKECTQRFQKWCQVRNHLNSQKHNPDHKKDCRFICTECGYRSQFNKDLVRHSMVFHQKVKWICLVCGVKIGRPDNLKRHQRKQHGY